MFVPIYNELREVKNNEEVDMIIKKIPP
jgi:hypothetical protein